MKNNLKLVEQSPEVKQERQGKAKRKFWMKQTRNRRVQGAKACLADCEGVVTSSNLKLRKGQLQNCLKYLDDERFQSSEDEEEDESGVKIRFKRKISFETDLWSKVKRYSEQYYMQNILDPGSASRVKLAKDTGLISNRSCPTSELPFGQSLPQSLFKMPETNNT